MKRELLLVAGVAFVLVTGCGKKDNPAKSASAPNADPAGPAVSDLIITPPGAPGAAAMPDPKAVAVTVDDRKLLEVEIAADVERALAQGPMGGLPPEMMGQARAMLRKRVIENFVAQTLLSKEADRQKIEIQEPAVTAELETVKKQLPPGTDFATALQTMGMTEEKLREEIRQSLRIRQMVDVIIESIPAATDEELTAFYKTSQEKFAQPESVHARHILIACKPDADEKTKNASKTRAETLRQQIVDGADFAEVAEKSSEDPGKGKGGDIGTITRGQTDPAFEKAAFAQATNEVGPVIASSFGYHIIQVLQHDKARQPAFEDVREELTEQMRRQAEETKLKAFLDDLRAQSKIVLTDDVKIQ